MILLATGISSIEEELIKQIEAQRCYNRDILVDIAKEIKAKTIVLSPYLPGEEELFHIILSLRNLGKRIIFLPGDPKQQDAQDWMIKLIPFGIYDYVYDPVKTTAIIDRIKTPATLGDIPQAIVKAAGEDSSEFAKGVVDSIQQEPEKKNILGALTRLFKRPVVEKTIEDPFGIQEDVEITSPKTPERVLLLGSAQSLAAMIQGQGWEITLNESEEYDVALADMESYQRAHPDKPVLVVGASMELFFSLDPLAELVLPVANESAAIKYLEGKLGNEPVPQKPLKQGVVAGFYSGAQGYQGKTVLALNTAAMLALEKSVCIVDLDTDKSGLTVLCGWNEKKTPPVDLWTAIESSEGAAKGPGETFVIPARLDYPGWLPSPMQINSLISRLAAQYDYIILDFGARVASPSTIAALKRCETVFITSTPFRGALSAVARFRGREMAEIGGSKIKAVINRVGADGAMTAKDAAAILGFNGTYTTIPEDPAFVAAETKALNGKKYVPPVLGKCESKKAVQKLANLIKGGRA